jgi:hypothetical protein
MTTTKPQTTVSRECNSERCKNKTPIFKRGNGFQNPNRCTPCKHSIRNYGITTPQRKDILDKQSGLCLCCNGNISFSGERYKSACSKNAVVDHCHKSGKVRGILCGNCNLIIGRLKDDLAQARLVIEYMEFMEE